MTLRLMIPLAGVALVGGLVLLAGPGLAQDGRAATRSLNTGPEPSILTVRPAPPAARTRTLEQALAQADAEADTRAGPGAASAGVILAEGQTEPEPIPMTLGYYVRGDLACEQAWPGDGDLAFATPTAFTLDFGGCEPGPWLQTGPNSWREEQSCITESGGDAGGYSVTYEVIGTDAVIRTARLALDDSFETDRWRYCPTDTLSANARFRS